MNPKLCVCEEIQVIVEPSSITVRAGQEAQFDCSAQSHVEVDAIEWTTRDGGRLPEGAVVGRLNLLSFYTSMTNAAVSHARLWSSCTNRIVMHLRQLSLFSV